MDIFKNLNQEILIGDRKKAEGDEDLGDDYHVFDDGNSEMTKKTNFNANCTVALPQPEHIKKNNENVAFSENIKEIWNQGILREDLQEASFRVKLIPTEKTLSQGGEDQEQSQNINDHT
jgi:hypothetical protein